MCAVASGVYEAMADNTNFATGANDTPLPYGINDLDPQVQSDKKAGLVRCYVRDCKHWLNPPRRRAAGDICPDHGIFCHSSNTYDYADMRRNIIADPDLFFRRVIGHPDKFESGRFGQERSEDAVSWNVFRSLQRAGLLKGVAALAGERHEQEPTLYLWGLRVSDDSFVHWELLRKARARFETNLPVKRPKTEPDIALHLPGQYLILIEAKFTSDNSFYTPGPRKGSSNLTFAELLDIYWDQGLRILNRQEASGRNRVPYQLYRNTIFSEFMAALDSPATRAYHLNLVRDGYEEDTAVEFTGLLNPGFVDRFARITWEQLYAIAAQQPRELGRLRRYIETKSEHLIKAFRV